MDCGTKLVEANYTESCTTWYCTTCEAKWWQTRKIVVEWNKEHKTVHLRPTIQRDTTASREGVDPDTGSDYGFHKDVMEE
jgi:hypothetical protein